MDPDYEAKVRETGFRLFGLMEKRAPSIFRKEYWTSKLLEWCMEDETFKVEAFRFIDVFPSLASSASLLRHLREYFGHPGIDIPPALKGVLRSIPNNSFAAGIIAKPVALAVEAMARHFIAGSDPEDALPILLNLRAGGTAFTVDLLGELVLSEKDADGYLGGYKDLLDLLGSASGAWAALGPVSDPGRHRELDWGVAPKVNISVKASAMYSRFNPCAFKRSVSAASDRLRFLFRKAVAQRAFLTFDMEHRAYKNLTLAVYKNILEEPEFRGYPYTGLAIQAYLRESEEDLQDLIRWARQQNQPVTVRLVKGAYWDSEIIGARQNNWPLPVFANKHATDANFEKLGRIVLENHDIARLACASHNIRSIAAVTETARGLGVPPGRLEYQVLYGMGDPVRRALHQAGLPHRVYAPVGEMIPGMSYLVRRLLENTANESFLRQGLARNVNPGELLRDPLDLLMENPEERDPYAAALPESDAFRNEPPLDWTLAENRNRFEEALKDVRQGLPKKIPLYIAGRETTAGREIRSVNPNAPEEAVALVSSAEKEEAQQAIRAARGALPSWRDRPPRERAEYLFRAAAAVRRKRSHLAALQVLEAGKGWSEADADVIEAIDYLEYYARQMIRLGGPRRIGSAPGEESFLSYEPRGVAVVIPPWNFPLAIPVGMTSAALVTGNTVVLKPASQAPATAEAVSEVFREAGLPPGVLNFLPGPGDGIGDFLVSHPDVALIGFTGSRDVGLRIVELAAKRSADASCVKQVIAEMGGKNAIIVDADADLDEAVVQILHSAFSYQGQKCSACSRLIVLDEIYGKLLGRLRDAAESLIFGPSEDPANDIGAVIEKNAQAKILSYLEIGKGEGEIVIERPPGTGTGYIVPLAIFTGIRPGDRLAQEEIFGPILSVIRVRDIGEALQAANSTPYALTGGIFSRSPENIARARREFRVGNLYINRGITGAVVGRHPFGGFGMSGVGSKAGGPDYLLQFMVPRAIAENTVRRGFAPVSEPPGRNR